MGISLSSDGYKVAFKCRKADAEKRRITITRSPSGGRFEKFWKKKPPPEGDLEKDRPVKLCPKGGESGRNGLRGPENRLLKKKKPAATGCFPLSGFRENQI